MVSASGNSTGPSTTMAAAALSLAELLPPQALRAMADPARAAALRKLRREIIFFIAFSPCFRVGFLVSGYRAQAQRSALDGTGHDAGVEILLEERIHHDQGQAGDDDGGVFEQLGQLGALGGALD